MAEESKIPTSADLKGFPRRAIVAFAARCARRVEPLFAAQWPDTMEEDKAAVRKAIEVAEAVANGNVADAYAANAADAAANAAYAAANTAKAVVVAAMAYDLRRLRDAAEREQWTNETQIPPEFFGPLWPEGEPPGWPWPKKPEAGGSDDRQEVVEPKLVIAWDPSLLTEDEYAELVEAIAEVARAEGGAGLVRVRSRGFGVAVESGVTP